MTATRPMKHDPQVIARLGEVMAERSRLNAAIRSLRAELAGRRQKVEDLGRDLGEAQKLFHLGEGDEDQVHEIAHELSQLRELDGGADLAVRDLQRELGKSDRAVETLLKQVVAGVDGEVERRRREMLEGWMAELAEFLRPLQSVNGPGLHAADFATMIRNEARSIHRITDALQAAKYDAPHAVVSTILPDGRRVPSSSLEGIEAANRALETPSGYDQAAALMRTGSR